MSAKVPLAARVCVPARPSILLAVAVLGLLGAIAPARASATFGTITVTSGGVRSATDTSDGYATALGSVGFQRGPRNSTDPATLTGADWVALCTTNAAGTCTSGNLEAGEYLVREHPSGAPAGWRTFTQLSWGGGSSGASPVRSYVGRVTVTVGNNTTVHPSTAYNPVASNTTAGRFVLTKNNPALPAGCGLDLLLLLDRSGSIGDTAGEAAQYQAAATAFVTALAGTPTRLKIFSFAATATADQNSFLDLSAPAGVTAANTAIASAYSSPTGGTNWDAGLALASGAGVDGVIFITDGNPTVWAAGGSSSTVDLLDLTAGIASANKVKSVGKSASAGATVLAIGVGAGVTAANLSAVSGPAEGVDWFTSGLDQLGLTLKGLANQLCGSRIHVRSLTDEGDPTAAKPGWTITAGKPVGSPVGFTPPSVVTNGIDSHDTIAVDAIPSLGAPALTVTQTGQPGYTLAASQCQLGSFPAAASGGIATQTIATVNRNQDWYCTFRNVRNRPTIVTTATASAAVGQPISDIAVLGGLVSPSGTRSITFRLFGPSDPSCVGTAVFTSTVTVTSNGSYTSATFTPTSTGTYRWVASYSGDTNNLAASGVCNDNGERSVVEKASPTISTSALTPRTAGQTIRDTATVGGLVNPSGSRSVTFRLYGPNDLTCSGASVFTSTVAVNGNGAYDSASFTAVAAGTYRWIASYSGDDNNAAVTGQCGDAGETTVVEKASPTISTNAVDGLLGGSIRDSATLGGGVSPTGFITFMAYGPTNGNCSGVPVFTSIVAVSANGTYQSAAFAPLLSGTYRWIAAYSGDANNSPVSGACNDAGESSVVGKLIVIVQVINDNGGTKVPGDFTVTVDDPGANPPSFPGQDSPGTDVPVDPGTYTVAEGPHAGYTVEYGADCLDTVLAVGQTRTCTIINRDIPPRLTVIKQVVNKNGSTAVPSDFTMHVDGTDVSTASFPGAADPGTTVTLDAGQYGVTETGDSAQYRESRSAGCSGSIGIGEEATCTITNTRRTGHITVVKQLAPVQDAGRFNLQIDGVTAGTGAAVGNGGTTGAVEVNTGDRVVSETAVAPATLDQYARSISCVPGGQDGPPLSALPLISVDGSPLTVAVGDGADIRCTVTNTRKATLTVRLVSDPAGAGQTFGFSSLAGGGAFQLSDGGSKSLSVVPGAYPVTMDDPRPAGWKLVNLGCTETAIANSTWSTGASMPTERLANMVAEPGESVVCTFTVRQVLGQTVVVKAGNVLAYHGDTVTYSFSVTNTGNSSLHNVRVTDNRCPNVSALPTSRQNDSGDELLDPLGVNGTSSEVWVYTCTYTLGAHQAGEVNPIVNTATVSGLDEYDRPVSDTDVHSTTVRHQSLSIDKVGPATATAGDAVNYGLAVKNTGDTSFVDGLVVVKDALCEAPPTLVSKGTDTTPATLDPGETWAYACTVRSEAAQSQITNIGTVVGLDVNGRGAGATDTFVTTLAAGAVLGETVVSGTARLRAPTGCLQRPASAIVTGRRIKSVTFTLDGRKIRTISKPDSRRRYLIKVSPARLRSGAHTIKARVVFVKASGTRARTLSVTFQKCVSRVLPAFTG